MANREIQANLFHLISVCRACYKRMLFSINPCRPPWSDCDMGGEQRRKDGNSGRERERPREPRAYYHDDRERNGHSDELHRSNIHSGRCGQKQFSNFSRKRERDVDPSFYRHHSSKDNDKHEESYLRYSLRNKSRSPSPKPTRKYDEARKISPAPKASGLLGSVPIHPLLMTEATSDTLKTLLPQTNMTSLANIRAAAEKAANCSSKLVNRSAKKLVKEEASSAADDRVTKFLAIKPKESVPNPFHDRRLQSISRNSAERNYANALAFCPRGKFSRQAEKIRTQAEMELLRRQVAADARMAGLDLVADRLTRGTDQVPEYDWWDAPFALNGEEVDNNLLNNLIQRPPLISAVVENVSTIVPKALHLTQKERKKLRRIRRLEAQREKQDLIQAGLLPPDQPRLKFANLPRLLAAAEGVSGPSSIETEVKANVQARHEQHLLTNEARRNEAAFIKTAKPVIHGNGPVNVAVYLLSAQVSLVSEAAGPLRFKLVMNARQNKLTGCVLGYREEHHTGFTLIIAEGCQDGAGLNRYKNLLMNRIKWHQYLDPSQASTSSEKSTQSLPIQLIWEGTARSPAFDRFEIVDGIESSIEAADFLTQRRIAQYWRLGESIAKSIH